MTGAAFKALKEVPVETAVNPSALLSDKDYRDRGADYLRRGEASGYCLIPAEQQMRYVLVIDEINRGNISRILGELITLLEEDKRLGADNALSVTLPFSGETFALPPNLYIVGTMNTADKSIALVDIALRRRFTFTEMRPRFDLEACKSMTPENVPQGLKVMQQMNQRILLRKDRDHRIGHAYFATVKDEAGFNKVMRNCILPLLSEYFWGDWDGLRYVLGETGTDGSFIRKIEGGTAGNARNQWQWYFDADETTTDDFDALASLRKNYGFGE